MNADLNYRVATEVMGYSIHPIPFSMSRTLADGYVETYFEMPDYSGDIAMAMLVVDELNKRKFTVAMCYQSEFFNSPIWYISFVDNATREPYRAEAEGLPLAICIAALTIVAKLKAATETQHESGNA